jgi:hypothetical protein
LSLFIGDGRPERGNRDRYPKEKKMDPVTVVLVVLGFLMPSLTGLINSAADRNRDAGKAEIIRAQRDCHHPRRKPRTGRRNA